MRKRSTPPGRRAIVAAALVSLAVVLLVLGVGRARAGDDPDHGGRSAAAFPLPTTKEDFFLPGTQPGALKPNHSIIDPTTCNTCHTDPIYKAWRGSMMGQAGRDPVFWAAFAVARADAADAGTYCLRCHAPRAWYEGRSEPTDGSGMTPEDTGAGVACEVCHRMVDPVPGAQDEVAAIDTEIRAALTTPPPANHFGSAMLILDPEDRRRGPFSFPPHPTAGPHQRWQARFQGQDDPRAASRLCGSCHNVDNPLLSWNENPPGGGPAQYWPNENNMAAPSFDQDDLFPIERTYEEWLNSDYANGGVYAPQFAGAKQDGIVASCQDCHMTRLTGIAAETFFNPVFRDCVTTGCLPAHIFVGGNSWVPEIVQDPRWRLNSAADASALNQTILESRMMLRRAATLQLTLDENGGLPVATVRVINETGHKLPTGYPEGRRLWLNVKAFDASGALVYESGAYDPATGQLGDDPALKVYEAQQGLTPEMAAVVGLGAGPTFHFALNNTTYKDNRIPPRGYTVEAFDRPGLRPVGASYDDGQYWDDTAYELPAAAVRVVATLYYQTASDEYIDFLRTNGGADGATLGEIWDDSKSPPDIVAQAEFPPPRVNYLPMSSRP
jgi:hypothetical protein